ncbi:DoxX family protein [Robertmurraya kyonggiensis]|uniref:DoxX family protein n=1 Tax=Robertmurraya kyonggiensis TaxID=1037680 RepID=A0A4U1D239_9BACI|nr:DoxX family protein [Robertmurraya kyonggiensis]TKC16291.1 DoxX family protein [Robertmurraya kyonggiensis]
MIGKLLRENNIVAGALTLVRIYLGWHWMTAGWGKLTEGFDAAGFLKGAVANPVVSHDVLAYPGWVSFLESFAVPNAGLFSTLIPLGEFLVGLGLILGCLTTAAAFFAMVMNFSFMFSGTISSNPMDILMGVFIAAAGYNAGKFGLDRYVLPYLRKLVFKGKSHEGSSVTN